MRESGVAVGAHIALGHVPRIEPDLVDPVDGRVLDPLADVSCCHPATAYPLGHGRRVTVDVEGCECDQDRAEESEPDAGTNDPSDQGEPEPLRSATNEHRPPVEGDDVSDTAEAEHRTEAEEEVPLPLAGLVGAHRLTLLGNPAQEHGLAPASSDEQCCEEHEVGQVRWDGGGQHA